MYTSIKAKLFAAALQNAALVYLLGSGSPLVLRWYDSQLPQSSGTGFPAVVVTLVSNPSDYVASGRLPTSWTRMQFTVYGTGNDSQNADAIVEALSSFLDNFNGDGVTGRLASPSFIVNDRDMGIAETNPRTYIRIVDAKIFVNSTV